MRLELLELFRLVYLSWLECRGENALMRHIAT